MFLLLLLLAVNAPESVPVVLEQVSIAVKEGIVEVTTIPAPNRIVLQAEGYPIVHPTKFTAGQTPDAQWGIAYFNLSDLPPGDFNIIVSAQPCERRIAIWGKTRQTLTAASVETHRR